MSDDIGGRPIPEWAKWRGLGKTTAYKLIKQGRGPNLIYPSPTRPIVTAEADREWRERMEAEAAHRVLLGRGSR